MLIDSHIHLYAEQFDTDREDLIQKAEKRKIKAFVLPNIDKTSIDSMLSLTNAHPDTCFPAMGLHPCSVKNDYEQELEIVKEHLYSKKKFYAVGELGIDLHWDTSTFDIQKKAMIKQMEWASELDKPIIIHSRKSTQIIIDLLKEHKSLNSKGVFHCFSGNENEAMQIIDLGFYLGIGGVVTFKNGGLDKSLENIDLQHLLLETDAPYLSPVPYRGKRNEPAYVELVAKKLAEIKLVSLEHVSNITTSSSIQLFNLPLNEKK